MRRREFVILLGGAAIIWPLAARAQPAGRVRRVGVLIPFPDGHEPRVKDYLSAFKQRLHELGWDEGRNIRFDFRFTGQVPERMRAGAEELIALTPDIIVVWANPAAAIVRNATQTVPIVFVVVSDPVGGGFVTNLARPGGNITGVSMMQGAGGLTGKRIELLKDTLPAAIRIGMMFNPDKLVALGSIEQAEQVARRRGLVLVQAPARRMASTGPRTGAGTPAG